MKPLTEPSSNVLCPGRCLWPPPGDCSLGVRRLMVRRGCRSRGWVLHVLGSLSSPRWSALGHGQQHKREEHGMPTLVNCASHTRASLFYESESEAAQSCLTLWDPMGRSPPSSSIHGISQARVLEWVAISSSRGSFPSRNQTRVSGIGRRLVTTAPPGKPPLNHKD